MTHEHTKAYIDVEDDKSLIQWITFVPAIIVELLFCIWLIYAGGKEKSVI